MTSHYSFLQLMSHIYGIVPYYLEPGEAFPLPTIMALLSPGSIPLRGTAASQSIPVYRSTPAFGVLRTVYLYSTIAPHVVLLGIVFWMAGEAELSTEISSSVDGLSYILYACTYNLSCRRTTSWHLCDSHLKPSPYSGPAPISMSARHSSAPISYAKQEPAAS